MKDKEFKDMTLDELKEIESKDDLKTLNKDMTLDELLQSDLSLEDIDEIIEEKLKEVKDER
jgi:hypothetical protein